MLHTLLPTTELSCSRTLEGLFEQKRRPAKAVILASDALIEKLKMNKGTVLGEKVPGHRLTQLKQNLDSSK